MESDLPLMELAEEDDSLIQPFPDPKQTPSKSSFNYFNCSPLALPPSRTKSLKDVVHTEKPSSSSSEASNNKENINSNNVEMPKLGMGPIQMKRRKKVAEYNLRKSLAWDRAFFTDEGILDPRELNLITGINAYTCGRGLPTISEEGNSSFSSGSRCRNEPNDMEASKEALLKELHDKSRTSKGNRVGNHDSLPHHKVTHKVLLTDHSNRTRSKVGVCSEPSPVSSLKRPNSNILRTAKKESKLPKLPMSKLGSCSSATTKGSITASQLRHNLIPKPPINSQKNVGLKSSLKDVHGTQGKAKTGLDNSRLPAKELAQKTVRILTHSSSKATSSTKSQLVHVDKANSGLEMVPDRLHSCEIQDESTPLAAKTLAQYTPTTSVKNNSFPSGLRLPSPSLRFFDQFQTTATPKTPSGRCSVLNSLTTPCGSPSSNYMVNKGVLNSNVYQDIVRKMQYECSASDVESHNVIEEEKRILGHKDKMGMKKIALKGDEEIKVSHLIEQNGELSGNDERVPFVLETKHEFVLHNEENKLHNNIATLVSTSGQSIQHQEQNLFKTESVMQVAQCVSTYPQTLKEEGLDIIPTTIETEFRKNNENQKHQEMGIIIENLLTTTHRVQAEGSKISFGEEVEVEAEEQLLQETQSPTMLKKRSNNIKRQDNSSIKHPTNAIEACDEDVVQTSRGLADTEKTDTPESHLDAGSLESHRDRIGKKDYSAKVVDESSLPMEDDARCNTDTMLMKVQSLEEENQMHHELGIINCNMLDQSIIHGCDLENSKISFGEEVEAQVHHELDNGSNLKKNKDSTVLMKRSNNIKRQDNKSLATIEAPGENLAQTLTKRDEADTKKSNACKVNPVESQRDEIGKIEDDIGATTSCISALLNTEGHSGKFIMPAESSSLQEEGPFEIATEINHHIFQEKNGSPNVLQEGNNKEATVLMKKSSNIKRQDKSLVIQAVPFSDEWLAAIEAAGEEILTMKCGAVQHSPPDKSIPERNPWSPVKNKANQIGPYDCTKYTNAMPSNPHLSDS